jgi:hypothetical protein
MVTVKSASTYERYRIETQPAPDIVPWPSRFRVKVARTGLAKHLIKELIHYRADLELVLSRPCVYGVFSGPVGGFAPREELCVGCLRCTTQHPEFVKILPNPERQQLGDSYFTAGYIDTIAYEASTGSIPVKGAGYRGPFAGPGWDGIWTDMSEIVRPTRDGIHGREFISTVVDMGSKPSFLSFDASGALLSSSPQTFQIPIPILLDRPPSSAMTPTMAEILADAAAAAKTLAILPLELALLGKKDTDHIVPLVSEDDAGSLQDLSFNPRMVEMDVWSVPLLKAIRSFWPETTVCLRVPFGPSFPFAEYLDAGVNVYHLVADYHGRGANGRFVFDLIRDSHEQLTAAGRRDEVTLLGSGGVIAAEHVPKAIIAGLDAVAIDTPILAALQCRFEGELVDADTGICELAPSVTVGWGVQRLLNMTAAWRDQLLEVLGAMGLREVRRLRGEMGRAMFHDDLEREAFSGIEGYDG